MILDLDVGNSRVKWRSGAQRGAITTESLQAGRVPGDWDRLSLRLIRIASVGHQNAVKVVCDWAAAKGVVDVRQARTAARCAGVRNSYADPSRMGVDRWLAMLAGYRHAGGACCVVDCGSAITLDYVAADGTHLGGYIMPGLRLMRLGLLGNTQQIRVEHDAPPDTRPGCSTEEAVQHGLHLMVAALAERVVRDTRRLLPEDGALLVCGGDGALFVSAAECGELLPDLVLDGLALAWEDSPCAG
ncbi:type III pantothenate kinase [Motiliproteus sediminis]|uniref:type III pantothenate kinase n=1 Tax=Motiliproteus sediminis TaxID=1468178 RepID=UPI001AEFBCC7